MSEPNLDELAEAARNRGLKLVRSRVRTPTKRRFGKAGLTDKSGKPVFGMDSKGPTAKPEEVEDYLRNLGASDWGASLGAAAPQAKAQSEATRAPAKLRRPRHSAQAEIGSRTKPQIREAKPGDSPRLVELIHELGHEIDEKSVRKNLATLKKAGESPLVATIGKTVVGLIGRGTRW